MTRPFPFSSELPIAKCLEDICNQLQENSSCVLIAPPGAGKTTIVPLALLTTPFTRAGKIIMLEPRRLSARAAAKQMARLLGEEVGQSVGYAMRMDTKQSDKTRILVVTEGVMARMILDDPELSDISTIIFDEFHERSLDGDFALALALDVQQGLREDLRLLIMSATLDGAKVATILGDAPIIESEGRSFPVDITYQPRKHQEPIETSMSKAVLSALKDYGGDILAFLPGQREIERTAERLRTNLPPSTQLAVLYGAIDQQAQDAAIQKSKQGTRKIVLATAIAETSITIDGVKIVIDSGLSRLPHYEPATGLTRLETVRVSQAGAKQRAGRAGRTDKGTAIRLWHEQQTTSLPAFTPPEILNCDLANLVLDCAAFGVQDPTSLSFMTPPPTAGLKEATQLLISLGALDANKRLTDHGKAMRQLGMPVRLAHMCLKSASFGCAKQATQLAMLLSERGLGGQNLDLDDRLRRFQSDHSLRVKKAKSMAASHAKLAQSLLRGKLSAQDLSTGAILSFAYFDRIAKNRGNNGRFHLANGRGAMMDDIHGLAQAPFIVVAQMQGSAQNARILSAATISRDEIDLVMGEHIKDDVEINYEPSTKSLNAKCKTRLNALVLVEKKVTPPQAHDNIELWRGVFAKHGFDILPWSDKARQLRQRLTYLQLSLGEPWPAMDDSALLERFDEWIAPYLETVFCLDDLKGELYDSLKLLVPFDMHSKIDHLAPTTFTAPTGNNVTLHYGESGPILSIRVQELFGLKTHPSICDGKIPITLELLSPAQRPIQKTQDLPGFWAGSWADVRADMRARYIKHPWPEDPANAPPTTRRNPRK